MRFGIIIAGASIREDGLDFTRLTVTNQPDMGLDYNAQGKAKTLVSLCEIGTGQNLEHARQLLGDPEKKIEARFDVKTTDEPLAEDSVDKLAADVRKHPNINLHILAGGAKLTPSAATALQEHQENLKEDGKILIHIDNQGLTRLANEYKKEIFSALGGPTGKVLDGSGDDQK